MFGLDRVRPADDQMVAQMGGGVAMPPAIGKAMQVATAKEVARAYTLAVRAEGASRVAILGVRLLAELEAEESRAIAANPHTGGARQRHIVDAYAATVADCVRRAGAPW